MATREEAMALLREYTHSEALIKHALAVEAAMRAYARHFGADAEQWGVVGLLHDFDYERWPMAEDHPFRGAEILRQRAYPEEIVRAVLSHADYSEVPRETLLEKTLFAVDELAGFIIAVALVRPSRRLAEVDVPAVRKKMKQKAFAANVNRDDITRGAEALGIPLDEHLGRVIAALQAIAPELGL
ncbi:MAG: HDIG domain-containing protein [Armatimonadetes bacterium]|jgi:putative nucleotidyltransferase with HDIG domain|nr:HDIG domain-containing protein [Armatimonadota bacterium]